MRSLLMLALALVSISAYSAEIPVRVDVTFTKQPVNTSVNCRLFAGYSAPHVESHQVGTGNYYDHGGQETVTVIDYKGTYTRYDLICGGFNMFIDTFEPELSSKQNVLSSNLVDYRSVYGKLDLSPLLKREQSQVCDTGTLRAISPGGSSESASVCITRLSK